jgi:ribosome maturation factor RimP
LIARRGGHRELNVGDAPHIFLFVYARSEVLRKNVSDAVESLVVAELGAMRFELVELRRGGTRGRPVLDVRIDRLDGGSVTVDDCARVSRALEGRLDASGLVGDRYVLEVSSPGAERPLRGPDDWRRFAGRTASVKSDALGGRAEVEVLGLEGAAGSEVAVVRTAQGEERRVPLAAVQEARLVFHWKR